MVFCPYVHSLTHTSHSLVCLFSNWLLLFLPILLQYLHYAGSPSLVPVRFHFLFRCVVCSCMGFSTSVRCAVAVIGITNAGCTKHPYSHRHTHVAFYRVCLARIININNNKPIWTRFKTAKVLNAYYLLMYVFAFMQFFAVSSSNAACMYACICCTPTNSPHSLHTAQTMALGQMTKSKVERERKRR